MSELSFLLYKTEIIGGFPFYSLKDSLSLREEEYEFFESKNKRNLQKFLPYVKLASKIAKEHNLNFQEALNLTEGGFTDQNIEVFSLYNDEISELLKTNNRLHERHEAVTFFINSRVDQFWFVENQSRIEAKFPKGLGSAFEKGESFGEKILIWTIEQTRKLPKKSIDEIEAFIQLQQTKGKKASVDFDTEDKDQIDFLSAVSKEESKPLKQTGQKSTVKSTAS